MWVCLYAVVYFPPFRAVIETTAAGRLCTSFRAFRSFIVVTGSDTVARSLLCRVMYATFTPQNAHNVYSPDWSHKARRAPRVAPDKDSREPNEAGQHGPNEDRTHREQKGVWGALP